MVIYKKFLKILSLCLCIIVSSHAEAIECTKASTEVEQLICSDSEIQQLDTEINKWYKKVIRYITLVYGVSRDEDVGSYNKWLKDRDSFNCMPANKDKKACLVSIYNDGIQVFKNRMLAFELWRACGTVRPRLCNFKPAEKLLKAGADLNGYEFYKRGPEGPVFYHALGGRTVDVIKFAVANGAEIGVEKRKEINYQNELTRTDVLDEIEFLLNYGVDVNKRDRFGRTPLFIKIDGRILDKKNGGNRYQIIKKLIEAGTDVNLTDNKEDNTPLIAIFNTRTVPDSDGYETIWEITNLLIAHGADIKHKNKKGHDALYYLQNNEFPKGTDEYKRLEKLLLY